MTNFIEEKIIIEIVKGVEGDCLVINDFRIAGPKPWGGGTVVKIFKTDLSTLKRSGVFDKALDEAIAEERSRIEEGLNGLASWEVTRPNVMKIINH